MKAIKIIALVLVCVIVVGIVAFGIVKHDEVSYVKAAMDNAIATIKDGTWQDIIKGSGSGEEESEAPKLTFTPGTYGGVNFESFEDVANYYNTVYDATKAETAVYKDKDGGTPTFYAMLGTENLELKKGSLLVDGKENMLVSNLAPTLLGGMFGKNVVGLPPQANRDPNQDYDENGESLQTSRVVADDILNAEVVENEDGTITITIIPQTVNLSHKGLDAQGHFFNSLGAIDSTIDGIDMLSWASGTTEENCKVFYKDGFAKIKVDTAAGKIIEADYHMVAKVDITHATLAGMIKDKSASLTLWYDNHFPADDQYLMDIRGLSRT